MSDNAETSAHETARNLNNIMVTLRKGVENGGFKALLGKAPDNEPIFVFEWPDCPMFGTATAYFGPKDMENYAHANHPWSHMRAASQEELPQYYADVQPDAEQLKRAMDGLAEGKLICPITGTDQSRIYDHIFCVSATAAAQFKLLLCAEDVRWAVSFEMSSATKVTITDVQQRVPVIQTPK